MGGLGAQIPLSESGQIFRGVVVKIEINIFWKKLSIQHFLLSARSSSLQRNVGWKDSGSRDNLFCLVHHSLLGRVPRLRSRKNGLQTGLIWQISPPSPEWFFYSCDRWDSNSDKFYTEISNYSDSKGFFGGFLKEILFEFNFFSLEIWDHSVHSDSHTGPSLPSDGSHHLQAELKRQNWKPELRSKNKSRPFFDNRNGVSSKDKSGNQNSETKTNPELSSMSDTIWTSKSQPKTENRNLKCEIWKPKSENQNQKSEIWNLKTVILKRSELERQNWKSEFRTEIYMRTFFDIRYNLNCLLIFIDRLKR
jgi:hypothetical protein